MGGDSPAARAKLVRTLVEDCWSDQAGLDRMAGMLTAGYVHHTRGAYHCRLEGGLVAEDWDAFFPSA